MAGITAVGPVTVMAAMGAAGGGPLCTLHTVPALVVYGFVADAKAKLGGTVSPSYS